MEDARNATTTPTTTQSPSTSTSILLSTTNFSASTVTESITQVYNTTVESVTKSTTQNIQNSTNSTKGVIIKPTATILCSTTSTTTEYPFDEFAPPEGIEYIFVPLGVMIFVLVLSAVVIFISRKRKLERLRHRLMPLYNFDPGEEGEDDWETELLDEGFRSHQRRKGYQSMDRAGSADLFNTSL